jgi:hypothetical protein
VYLCLCGTAAAGWIFFRGGMPVAEAGFHAGLPAPAVDQGKEAVNAALHLIGPGVEPFHRSVHIIGHGGILLHHFFHLLDGRIDLIDPLGLFCGGSGNFRDDRSHLGGTFRRADKFQFQGIPRKTHDLSPKGKS